MNADDIVKQARQRIAEIDKDSAAMAKERETLQRIIGAAEGRAAPIEIKVAPAPPPVVVPMPYPVMPSPLPPYQPAWPYIDWWRPQPFLPAFDPIICGGTITTTGPTVRLQHGPLS